MAFQVETVPESATIASSGSSNGMDWIGLVTLGVTICLVIIQVLRWCLKHCDCWLLSFLHRILGYGHDLLMSVHSILMGQNISTSQPAAPEDHSPRDEAPDIDTASKCDHDVKHPYEHLRRELKSHSMPNLIDIGQEKTVTFNDSVSVSVINETSLI